MNNIINIVISLLGGIRPEIAPILEDAKADIASGKPVTLADISKLVNDGFTAAEADLPKYKDALEQTRILLNQVETTVTAWENAGK